MLLRPALRALFLQGRRAYSISVSVGEVETWGTVGLETFELSAGPQAYAQPHSGLNVALGLADIGDTHGPADEGYAMSSGEVVLGMDGPLPTTGLIPAGLEIDVSEFTEAAIDDLANVIDSGEPPPRANHKGLMWIFDPQHWEGLSEEVKAAQAACDLLGRRIHTDFLAEQVYEQRRDPESGETYGRPPNLEWLLDLAWLFSVHPGGSLHDPFWRTVSDSLQSRGEAHRLTRTERGLLSSPDSAPAWLDVVAQLLAAGVVDMGGLVAPRAPVEPLVERALDDRTVQLHVWGEDVITVRRSMDILDPEATGEVFVRTIDRGVAWDYVAGSDGQPPRVVIVASRGISIIDRWDPSFPWQLDIYRVQDPAEVPPVGGSIDTTVLLAPSLIEPDDEEIRPWMYEGIAQSTRAFPKLLARRKPDGHYLEFPVWGEAVDGPDVDPERAQIGVATPFVVELTVDPRSGLDAYIVDIHYYIYTFGIFTLGGAHICVWASEGVQIHSNGGPIGQREQGAGSSFLTETAWEASAEFWEADYEFIEFLRQPFQGHLEITDALTFHASQLPAHVPRFTDDGDTHVIEGRVTLTPKTYEAKNYTEGSITYDLIDLVVGFIPFVGDAVDVAELAIAWSTGLDKWGRPVSNYELAAMTVFAAVPLVSSAMARGVVSTVMTRDDWVLRQQVLASLMGNVSTGLDADPQEVIETLAASRAWQTDKRMTDTGARKQVVNDMLDFLADADNQDLIEAWAERLARDSGEEWLALPDILTDTGRAFAVPAMQDAFKYWGKKNPGKTPAEYIESGISGRAKIIAEALLGNEAVGGALRHARRVARRSNFKSAVGRPPRAGPPALLNAITSGDLATAADDGISRAMAPGSPHKILSTGVLRPVTAVVGVTAAFVEAGVRTLLDFASPTGKLAGHTPESLKTVAGGDKLNSVTVSLAERGARVADGVIVACEEARIQVVEPAVLFSPRMLPVLRDFVFHFVTRSGAENGSRFELAIAALMEKFLTIGQVVQGLRHQLRLPDLRNEQLRSGPDSVVYLDGKAHLVQLKSFMNLEDLVAGPVTVTKEAGRIVGVKAPKLIEQTIKDVARFLHWDHRVPPPGAELPTTVARPDTSGWTELGDTHVLVLDDQHLRDSVAALISDARRRTGKTDIDVMTDIDAPQAVRELIAATIASSIKGSDDLDTLLIHWLEGEDALKAIERAVDAAMGRQSVVSGAGKRWKYRVTLGSRPVSDIPKLIRGEM